ncbi:hypothetical protein SCHPADRAFT_1000098 [Schizopora paradoxa]|uniref:Zn(2)-C6 fungal-type domain-containing protein n=1 Tax=Schizopora paradoxa TaxID=27342 RepID=A0A0H2RCU7_9AGAM|nr:hypothetical protein SCHPADRAFT_1000098 [Schizopora paradoxa]
MPPKGPSQVNNSIVAQQTQFKQNRTNLKRAQGQISCAECRRLKLRCDKKVPCFTCTKRGCSNICPLGTLSSTVDQRPNPDSEEELLKIISVMSDRIHHLEDALRHECTWRSGDSTHPLLKDELLFAANGPSRIAIPSKSEQRLISSDDEFSDEEIDFIDATGQLTLHEDSSSSLIGASGTENALLVEVGLTGAFLSDDGKPELPLPSQIVQASLLWPFGLLRLPPSDSAFQSLLEAHLPPRERASGLVEAFLQNLSWFIQPITREQIVGELIPLAYQSDEKIDAFDLGLLFMVLAMGAAADLTLTPSNQEGERYRHLGRAALSIKPVFEEHSLSAVQAIVLISCYEIVSGLGRNNGPDYGWKVMSLAMRFSSCMFIYYEPTPSHEDPKLTQRRRLLFWELYAVDCWQSLAMGRPPSFRFKGIRCQFPTDPDASNQDIDPSAPSLWNLKYRFAKHVLTPVVDTLCSGRAYKYSDILRLDRLVRNFDKTHLNNNAAVLEPTDPQPFARSSLLDTLNELALMHIHRASFARALINNPDNPLRGPYAPSFLAAYRSAAAVLQRLRDCFSKISEIFFRHWPMWAYMLSAAVIVGSVVTKKPDMRLAPSAVDELRHAVEVFTAATDQPVVREMLPILIRIYEKAKAALDEARSSGPTDASGSQEDEDQNRLLDLLRGKTRVVQGRPRRENLNSKEYSTSIPAPQFDGDVAANPTQCTVPAIRDSACTPQSLGTPHQNETPTDHNIEVPACYGSLTYDTPPHYSFPLAYDFRYITNFDSMSVPDCTSTATSNSTPDPEPFPPHNYPNSTPLPYRQSMQLGEDASTKHPTSYTMLPPEHNAAHQFLQGAEPTSLFPNNQLVGEAWESFVTQSGFTTEEEMLRLWGISQT